MIRYNVKKSNSKFCSGRCHTWTVIEETLDLEQLNKHMSGHNSPFSQGVIHSVLTDMVRRIKETAISANKKSSYTDI